MPAKFNLLVAASIPAVAIVPLLACGGGGSGKTDAPMIVTHDSGSGSNTGSATCTFPATMPGTYTASGTRYTAAGSGTTALPMNRLDFDALVGGSVGSDDEQILRVLIYGGCGATGTGCAGGSAEDATPDWPTVFTPKQNLTIQVGSDGLIQPVDVAILLLGDAGTTSFNTGYIAVGGTVNINAAANGSGHAFAGSAANLDLIHIDFNTGMVAADGCETTISAFSWNGSAFTGKQFQGADLSPQVMNTIRHRTM